MRHGELVPVESSRRFELATVSNSARSPDQFDRLFAEPTPVQLDERLANQVNDIARSRAGSSDVLPTNPDQGIPAGYTYLGQFIIHDLTRSQSVVGRRDPLNAATSSLDLDSVYADGPIACPHLFREADRPDDSPHLFHVGQTGKPLQSSLDLPYGHPFDVPRHNGMLAHEPGRPSPCIVPLTADSRNDENLVICQMQAWFTGIHNRVAEYFRKDRRGTDAYRCARAFVTTCYRRIVVYDYLRQILKEDFHQDFLLDDPQLISKGKGAIPLEFVFGAARAAHAMSRSTYTVNQYVKPDKSGLARLLSFSSRKANPSLPLPADWVIDWALFFKVPQARPQLARRFSPFLAGPLVSHRTGLAPAVPYDTVSFRDLWRAYQFNIPSGQECARQLQSKLGASIGVLTGDDLLPPEAFGRVHDPRFLTEAINAFPDFKQSTPLPYYILQEAAMPPIHGRTLGPLGSYIMATTFRRALSDSRDGSWPYSAPAGVGISTMPDFIELLGCPIGVLADKVKLTCPELLQ